MCDLIMMNTVQVNVVACHHVGVLSIIQTNNFPKKNE